MKVIHHLSTENRVSMEPTQRTATFPRSAILNALGDGGMQSTAFEPPVSMRAGDQMVMSADGLTTAVYRDGQLTQTYRYLDGVMRLQPAGAERIEPGAERIEPGADAAHRDDLARDAAQAWWTARHDEEETVVRDGWLSRKLTASLDRLADAYGFGTS